MKSKFNTVICSLLIVILTIACTTLKRKKICITNTSTLNYESKVVEIPWKEIITQYPKLDSTNFRIVEAVLKEEVPFQLEYAGNSMIKNVLVQLSLKANAIIELEIEQKTPRAITSKTFGRYVPERLDDFAWENDIIAFRMYGKALELQGKGNAYGTDVWVKKH